MKTKQLVSASVFGLVLSSSSMVQAGGAMDSAVGGIRGSVHEKADSVMDSVGLEQEKPAAEGEAGDGKSATGETPASAEGDASKDAAEAAGPAKESAGNAIPEAPMPSAEDATKETAKGAFKGLLD